MKSKCWNRRDRIA